MSRREAPASGSPSHRHSQRRDSRARRAPTAERHTAHAGARGDALPARLRPARHAQAACDSAVRNSRHAAGGCRRRWSWRSPASPWGDTVHGHRESRPRHGVQRPPGRCAGRARRRTPDGRAAGLAPRGAEGSARDRDICSTEQSRGAIATTPRDAGGIADLRFYDLRREFACRLLESRAELHDVRDFLEHANLTTTSRYLRSTALRLERALRLLEHAQARRGVRHSLSARGMFVPVPHRYHKVRVRRTTSITRSTRKPLRRWNLKW